MQLAMHYHAISCARPTQQLVVKVKGSPSLVWEMKAQKKVLLSRKKKLVLL